MHTFDTLYECMCKCSVSFFSFFLYDNVSAVFFCCAIKLLFHAGLSTLRHLLGSNCDEMVSGNAALSLAHCLELEGVASDLLGTDIVPLLLRHAAMDAKQTAVRGNAAIALGKLCQSEPRCVCF